METMWTLDQTLFSVTFSTMEDRMKNTFELHIISSENNWDKIIGRRPADIRPYKLRPGYKLYKFSTSVIQSDDPVDHWMMINDMISLIEKEQISEDTEISVRVFWIFSDNSLSFCFDNLKNKRIINRIDVSIV